MKPEKLKKLLMLQETELELKRAEKALGKTEERINHIRLKIQELESKKQALRARIQNLEKQKKETEEMIRDCMQRAKLAEQRLSFVKKAEEYKALLRERARYEDCTIKLSHTLEILMSELHTLKEGIEERKIQKEMAELEEDLTDLMSSRSRLLERFTGLAREFERLTHDLEGEVIEEYIRLKSRNGLPFILTADPSGACINCGTKLPSALFSRLIAGDVILCPSCGLFIVNEEPQ